MSNKANPDKKQPACDGLPDKYVITVGRTFGSGGRQLGMLLAERLGIDYYDKELLAEAAKHAGIAPELFEKNDERAPGFLSGIVPLSMGYNALAWYTGPSSVSSDGIYRAQCDFIRALADRRPCVIVGRSADYVLREHPAAVNIFVHAPEDDCVRRMMNRLDCGSEAAARDLARRTNRLREQFYNFYTDKHWGQASSYDLTFDSSKMSMEDAADLVVEYMKRRFGNKSARPDKD